MANDYNDYEELLKAFEDTSDIKRKSTDSASSQKKNDAKLENDISRSKEERRKKVADFNLQIDNEDKKPAYKGEVYFSNPPRAIKEEAKKQKSAYASIESFEPSEEKKADEKPATPPATQTQQKLIALKSQRKQKRAENISKLKKVGKGRKGGKKSDGPSKAPGRLLKLAIIVFVSTILSVYAIRCVNDVFALKTDDTSVEVTISSGTTDGEVLKLLKKNKLIKNRLFCSLFTKIVINDSDDPNEYVSGSYTLNPSMGLEKMLSTMQADITTSETVTLTFPEGWTIDEIAEKLESNKVCKATDFISTIQNVDFSADYPFVASLKDKDKRFRVLEGYIYPDTYDFYVGEGASSVIRRFLDNFKTKWIDSYQEKADELGMSMDEVMTLASILQEEAASSKEMKTISSIIHNRLDRPSTFQWLQCDSTEDYLLNTIKPSLTSSTEDTQKYIGFRDLYDTYSTECTGLPIGPISNPGDSAIFAALNPEETSYLYFRHDSDGKVYYASTLSEHEANGEKIASEGKAQ